MRYRWFDFLRKSAPVLALCTLLLQVFSAVRFTESRYMTSAGASASVRVASISLSATDPVLKSADAVLDCNLENDTVQYEMTLTNASEVDMNYVIHASTGSDNIRASIIPDQGSLSALRGSVNVTVILSVIDPDSRTQTETPAPLTIIVDAAQKGEDT
ncbi:MAG: hypothetical protein IK088_00595 [Lachnospiraceae bacterium]|nr:hypothetical protein [Lachnospiraceae bacterium]